MAVRSPANRLSFVLVACQLLSACCLLPAEAQKRYVAEPGLLDDDLMELDDLDQLLELAEQVFDVAYFV